MAEQSIDKAIPQLPLPLVADVGNRLSDGSDCWVIDCPTGSVAEMMVPKPFEEHYAKQIVEAVNSYDQLRTKNAALRKACEAALRRYDNEDKGGLATREGLAWAMAEDLRAALEVKNG